MPKGPNGEKRPADAVARAVMVAKIATGEIEDERPRVGAAGGRARAEAVPQKRRVEIARKGAAARWSKAKEPNSAD